MRKILSVLVLAVTLALAACGAGHMAGRSCAGPYQPVIASGGYLRVTGDGHGAARSNYRCDDGRLIETAPVR
jgi:hypothetical protein